MRKTRKLASDAPSERVRRRLLHLGPGLRHAIETAGTTTALLMMLAAASAARAERVSIEHELA